jgi:DNA-binding CsgD family transcriptional regulator
MKPDTLLLIGDNFGFAAPARLMPGRSSVWQTPLIELIGREAETQATDALLRAARGGMSATLVLRGEAGVGKTSILLAAERQAEGFRVLRVDGIQAEENLGFAALHRLLLPVLGESTHLPAPQRRALEATFGAIELAPPDRFLIGLAVLTLLAGISARRPLLCIIDDGQWLDGETKELLAFVARRLYAESLVMLIAVREPTEGADVFQGLPDLQIQGLRPAEALRLLSATFDRRLDVVMMSRLAKDTLGNPLALIELGRHATVAGRVATLLPDQPLPLSRRLEDLFERQVRDLPEATQRFLIVASAEPTRTDLVWKATERLQIPAEAADAAIEAGLFDSHGSLGFRHPLIRSAVYGSASTSDRRQAHAALAELLDSGDAGLRTYHRASAAAAPDEDIALELEEQADRAETRGGLSARAALMARAAQLTPDRSRRATRLLVAAEAALAAGNVPQAETLLQRAREDLADPVQLAHARRVEAAFRSFTTPGDVPRILLEAAEVLKTRDPLQARDTYIEALQGCLVSSQLTRGTTPAEVGAAALAAAPLWHPSGAIDDLLVEGFATRFAIGYREAVPALQGSVTGLCAETVPAAGLTRWAILGADAAADLWDAEGYRTLAMRLEKTERRRGALESLRLTLGPLAHSLMWTGKFVDAEVAHSEATEISVALGADRGAWEALKVELFAWQGRDEETRFIAELLMGKLSHVAGGGVAVNLARIALTILNIAQGRYQDALVHGLSIMEDDPCPHGSQVLPEVVEAAIRTGAGESAATALDRLRDRATASGTPWALGLLARCQALVEEDPDPSYRQALDLLGTTHVTTDLARTHLLYGEWLRRQKRLTEARKHLRNAYNVFDTMGAAAFADRVRTELAATGGRTRRQHPAAAEEMTPQERHIATLAAGGATNAEIAEQLFLSAATVDYHLRKVYRKLSVRSRRQLAGKL